MTGAWKGGFQLGNATDVGAVTASARGIAIPGPSSTFTKGTWVQVTASTATDCDWVLIYIETQNSAGANLCTDIGIGGSGSEIVIIPNLLVSSYAAQGIRWLLPVSIPAGTRIAARIASSATNDQINMGLMTLSDTSLSMGVASAVDTYGVNTSTNLGVAIDAGGTANTKGAYVQITSSVTNDLAGFILVFDTQNASTGNTAVITWLVDIAIGASGSEVVIMPNLFIVGTYSSGFSTLYAPGIPYLPIQIPAGTRVAARAECSVNASPDRVIGISLNGVRL